MLPEDLPFRIIRVNSEDEVIARANNLLVGRAAYRQQSGSIRRIRSSIGTGRGLLRGAIGTSASQRYVFRLINGHLPTTIAP